jgi:hypothetical protein
MRDIYHGAEKVLIWLGEEKNDSDLAINFIRTVIDVLLTLPPGTLLTSINVTDYGLPPYDPYPDRRWSALGNLLRRPWFQRVWVVQECVMAKDAVVLCGGRELQWSALEMLIVGRSNWPYATHPVLHSCVGQSNLMEPLGRTALKQVPAIVHAKIRLKGPTRRFDMAETIVGYKDCLATDHRDKLFAFLGYVPVETATLYSPPDYGRSVEDVYTEIAFVSLSKFSNLKILSYAGRGQQHQQYDIPSWVPNPSDAARSITFRLKAAWSIQRQVSAKIDPVVPLYRASKDYSPNFKVDLENGTLTVSGKIFGKLAAERLGLEIGPAPSTPEHLEETNNRILAVRQTKMKHCLEMASQCDPYPSGGTYISACKQTLVAGATLFGERMTAAEVEENFETYDRVVAHFLRTGPRLDDQTEEQQRMLKAGATTISDAIGEASFGRAFAVTEEKYVGLVPVKAKAGDYVCIILGCDVPFIVREDDGKYVLVGECYIHGIMDGEAMDMEKYKIQDIILK